MDDINRQAAMHTYIASVISFVLSFMLIERWAVLRCNTRVSRLFVTDVTTALVWFKVSGVRSRHSISAGNTIVGETGVCIFRLSIRRSK